MPFNFCLLNFYPSRSTRIIGGPATGKSRLLAAAAAGIARSGAGETLLLCRNRSDVDRMIRRLYRIAGNTAVRVETISGMAEKLVGVAGNVCTQFQERLFLQDILGSLPVEHYLYPVSGSFQLSDELADFLRILRLNSITPDMLPSEGNSLLRGVKRVYRDLEERISRSGKLTGSEILRRAKESVPGNIAAVLVDEAQELDFPSYDFLCALAEKGAMLILAGDPFQNIHRYQGADPDFLRERFFHDFPNAQTIWLKDSYRLGAERVAAALKLFDQEYPPFAPSPKNGSDRIYLRQFPDPAQETFGIAARIEQLIRREGLTPENIAVVVRAPRRSGARLKRAIELRGIPVGGTEFPFLTRAVKELFQRAGRIENSDQLLKDLPRLTAKIAGEFPHDDVSLESLARGRKLLEEAAIAMTSWRPLRISTAAQEQFLREPPPGKSGGVSVVSVHQAKDGDFKVVFIPELVENVFPAEVRGNYLFKPRWLDRLRERLPRPLRYIERADLDKHLREERRLFYIALSLAAEEVYFSRYLADDGGQVNPSLFLHQIGALSHPPPDWPSDHSTEGWNIFPIETGCEVDLRRQFLQVNPAEQEKFASRIKEEFTDCLEVDFITAPQLKGDITGTKPPKVEHLSAGALNTYLFCPRKYFYSHVLRVPYPTTPAMLAGKILHHALEVLHREKGELEGECALRTLDALVDDVVSGEESLKPKSSDAILIRNYVCASLEDYLSDSEFYGGKVLETEKKFVWIPREGIEFHGVMDRVDEVTGGLEVIDYKSSGSMLHRALYTRFSNLNHAKADIQLPLYYAAAEAVFRQPVCFVTLLPLSFKGGKPRRVTFEIVDAETKGAKLSIGTLEEIQSRIIELADEIISAREFYRGANTVCRQDYAGIVCPYISICDLVE